MRRVLSSSGLCYWLAAEKRNRFGLSGFTENWRQASQDQLDICDDHFSNLPDGGVQGASLMCAEQYVAGLSGWVGCQQWLLREHIGGDSDSTTPGKVDQGIEVD